MLRKKPASNESLIQHGRNMNGIVTENVKQKVQQSAQIKTNPLANQISSKKQKNTFVSLPLC